MQGRKQCSGCAAGLPWSTVPRHAAMRPRARPIAELRSRLQARIAAAQAELARLTGAAAASAPVARSILERLLHVVEGQRHNAARNVATSCLGKICCPLRRFASAQAGLAVSHCLRC